MRSVFLLIAALTPAFAFLTAVAPHPPDDGPVDHAAIIRAWDAEAYRRGEVIFRDNCTACHGADGLVPANPASAAFARDTLANGSDPYAMWRTLTDGYGLMPPQAWLSPEERYDVIHYVRERFFEPSNPSQYVPVTDDYLASLPAPTDSAGAAGEARRMDYGPALAYELDAARSALVLRPSADVSLYYDLHTLSVPEVWTDGFVDLSRSHHVEYKGGERAFIDGRRLGMGAMQWAFDGSFDDPRPAGARGGPVPPEAGVFRGHYLHGSDVILSYTIAGRDVLDRPRAWRRPGTVVVAHTLQVGPGPEELLLSLGRAEGLGAPGAARRALDGRLLLAGTDPVVAAGVAGAPEGAALEVGPEGRLLLRLPARSTATRVEVFRAAGAERDRLLHDLSARLAAAEPVADLSALIRGGPSRWPETLTTTGTRGGADAAYVLDRIDLPADNPWQSWMRPSDVAFFEDGRAALSTLNGDVWIVTGLDDDLDRVSWRRFATGLYEPLGLEIVDGTIYSAGRDRITALHDLDGDGEADFYESFYAFDHVSRGYHAFTFGLEAGRDGHLYALLSGRKTDYRLPGALLRVDPEGGAAEVVATGFRHPNGLSIGPDGAVYVSDNQGEWVPASKVSRIREGGFYGYVGWEENVVEADDFERPVVWLPQEADNSSGGQVWALDPRWGPLAGSLVHTSYGGARAFYARARRVDGVEQAAVVPFPWTFRAGLMRAAVNPRDGQVYVVGLKGWGTSGIEDATFTRIRYTGREAYVLEDAAVTARGVRLRFTAPLAPGAATDTSRFAVRRWNYRWTSRYGSPHYVPSVADYGQEGEEPVAIEAARLGADGRTLELDLHDHRPVDQLVVSFDLPSAEGPAIAQTVYFTVRRVPGAAASSR